MSSSPPAVPGAGAGRRPRGRGAASAESPARRLPARPLPGEPRAARKPDRRRRPRFAFRAGAEHQVRGGHGREPDGAAPAARQQQAGRTVSGRPRVRAGETERPSYCSEAGFKFVARCPPGAVPSPSCPRPAAPPVPAASACWPCARRPPAPAEAPSGPRTVGPRPRLQPRRLRPEAGGGPPLGLVLRGVRRPWLFPPSRCWLYLAELFGHFACETRGPPL